MNSQAFIQLCAGKWVSQRTNHFLEPQQTEVSRSDLLLEYLTPDHALVVQLCEQGGVNPRTALGGLNVQWSTTIEPQSQKEQGANLMVLVSNGGNPEAGTLLRSLGNQKPVAVGQYVLGADEVLTLRIDDGDLVMEERIWFASENLRLRSCTFTAPQGIKLAAFCSEIRLGVTPPKSPTETATASA